MINEDSKLIVFDLDETITKAHGNYSLNNIREVEMLRELYKRAVNEGHKVCIFTNQHDTIKISDVIGYITGDRTKYRNIKIVDSKNQADEYEDNIRIITGTDEEEQEFEELNTDMPQYTTSLINEDKKAKREDIFGTINNQTLDEILVINPAHPRIASKSHHEPHKEYGKAAILSFLAHQFSISERNILFIDDNEAATEVAFEKYDITSYHVKDDTSFKDALTDILTVEMEEKKQADLQKATASKKRSLPTSQIEVNIASTSPFSTIKKPKQNESEQPEMFANLSGATAFGSPINIEFQGFLLDMQEDKSTADVGSRSSTKSTKEQHGPHK